MLPCDNDMLLGVCLEVANRTLLEAFAAVPALKTESSATGHTDASLAPPVMGWIRKDGIGDRSIGI